MVASIFTLYSSHPSEMAMLRYTVLQYCGKVQTFE